MEQTRLQRFLDIVPGALAWATLLMPFILAPFAPAVVAYFILIFSLYWFFKFLNFARHLLFGFKKMTKYMKTDWYERCKNLKNLKSSIAHLENIKDDPEALKDLKELYKYNGSEDAIKNFEDIYQAIFVCIYKESYEIVEPTLEAIVNSNYPNKKIMIVLAIEERGAPESIETAKKLKEKYAKDFYYFDYFVHPDNLPDEVKGKGGNLYFAGKKFKAYLDQNEKIKDEDVLVTNIDGDHIIHKEYLGRLTYKYIIDPNREKKTYQPVALLFNNIWDTPALNRVAAVGSSFWQMIESMRPFRQRTFAAHTQSLKTLIKTDYWAKNTIVEDGHQFWRTYFAYGGHIEMVSLYIPVYQDAVLLDSYWATLKGQYLQRRRWAWGASDFSFVIINFMKHKEIPFLEKIIQTSRQFTGNYSWATASFLIAGAWIPLLFNQAFQETVLAHNITQYSSSVMRVAWIGIFLNIWIYMSMIPPKPANYGIFRSVGMITQWVFTPIVAIFLSSLPALEAQTRLMIGKRLEFWTTPKVRKEEVKYES